MVMEEQKSNETCFFSAFANSPLIPMKASFCHEVKTKKLLVFFFLPSEFIAQEKS